MGAMKAPPLNRARHPSQPPLPGNRRGRAVFRCGAIAVGLAAMCKLQIYRTLAVPFLKFASPAI